MDPFDLVEFSDVHQHKPSRHEPDRVDFESMTFKGTVRTDCDRTNAGAVAAMLMAIDRMADLQMKRHGFQDRHVLSRAIEGRGSHNVEVVTEWVFTRLPKRAVTVPADRVYVCA